MDTDKKMAKKNMEDFGIEKQWRQKFSEADLYKEFTSDENGENQLSSKEGEAKIHKLGGYEKVYRIKFESDYLAKLVYEGAERLYGKPLSQEVDERIRFELHTIKTMGFPRFFLIVQNIINVARNNFGIKVGPGRGTIAGSIVAYCLGITQIDPLKYDLLFERFLNPDCISLPDIIIDLDDDGCVVESIGLIKMNFCGLKTLSVLKDTVENIRKTRDVEVDLDKIPIDDSKTYQLYQEGRTIGTFYFGSPGMQNYLRELRPTVFEDLIAMNALYRPGPMEYIPEFIKRKNDPTLVTYDLPCMEKYLKDTYGIIVYQEQIMLLSRELANFTRGESETLRKALGKKNIDVINAMKPKFIEGGNKNGYAPDVLDKIWRDWENFGRWAFIKSHAVCYSWIAYQTAYLKAHYPAEYMAALLTHHRDDIEDMTKLMNECKSMGIDTLDPDINESFVNIDVNQQGEIRFGLAAIEGVGEGAAKDIVNERGKNGPFKDVFDLVERVNLNTCNRECLEALIWEGALNSLGVHREPFCSQYFTIELFLDTLFMYGKKFQSSKSEASCGLSGAMGEREEKMSQIKASLDRYVKNIEEIQRLSDEFLYKND